MLLNKLPICFVCLVALIVNWPNQISAVPLVGPASIRPLICINKITNQSGVCMFAMDCHRLNGTSLGVCGDRFYFGSCCLVPSIEDELNDFNSASETGSNFLDNKNDVVFKRQRQPPSATYLLDTIDDQSRR